MSHHCSSGLVSFDPANAFTGPAACYPENEKAGSTLRSSRAVPHPSTNRALRRLTSEVGRDPVHSTRYGRQRRCLPFKCNRTNTLTSGPPGHLYWLTRSKLRPCAGRVPGAHRARAGTALARAGRAPGARRARDGSAPGRPRARAGYVFFFIFNKSI